jgi:hypothetical protein
MIHTTAHNEYYRRYIDSSKHIDFNRDLAINIGNNIYYYSINGQLLEVFE